MGRKYVDGHRSIKISRSIAYGISECASQKQFDIDMLIRDITDTATANSRTVFCVYESMKEMKFISSRQHSVDRMKEMRRIHAMLFGIVRPNVVLPETAFIRYRDLRDILMRSIDTLESPSTAIKLQSTISSCLSPDGSEAHFDEVVDDVVRGECRESFVLETMQMMYPEKFDDEDIRNLAERLRTFSRATYNIDDIALNVNIDEEKAASTLDLLHTNCASFIPVLNKIIPLTRQPALVSKSIERLNSRTFIMNIVNVYAEMRLANHYINVYRRQHPPYVDEDPFFEPEFEVEPFGNNESVFGVDEFIKTYPLFEALRRSPRRKYGIVAKSLASTVRRIVKKVLRPLPFQPLYIICDLYSDFLMYTSTVSNLIYHQLRLDANAHLRLFHLPMQLDLLIIPQRVSEAKIETKALSLRTLRYSARRCQ